MNDTYKWYKSSYTNGQGNCVEVAALADRVAVRDSKDPDGLVLAVTPDEWLSFADGVQAGEFDLG
jgi:hypothetical protein